MKAASSTFVQGASAWLERVLAHLPGMHAAALRDFAGTLREEDLAHFPIATMCAAEERNAVLLEAERIAPPWRNALAAAARGASADARRLDAICGQRFIVAHGRRLTQIRELAAHFAT